MAIKNINNIQSNIDYMSPNNIDINYLIQSLTNLGQREGIKGSSIVYNYFTPEELGEISGNYIKIFNDNGIIKYSNFVTNDKNWTSVINFNDVQNISNINNKIINNISTYRNNVLNIKDNILYHFSCGEVLGSNKNEIIYTVYNLKTNIIEYAVRSFYLYNDGVSNYYCMLEIEKDNTKGVISRSGSNGINYILNLYLFNSSSFNNISSSKNLFEQCYVINDNLTNNINIIDIRNNIYNFKKTQLYVLFKNYEVKNSQFSINNLYYDIDNNTGFSIITEGQDEQNRTNYAIIESELNKELGLNTRLLFLTNDILYLYPKLLQLYNEDILNKQSNKYKFILENIFNYIYNSLDDKEKESFALYVPKGYKFRYQCDSKDKSKIYNSNNNFILLDSRDINDVINKDDKTLNNLYGYCGETSDSKIINIYYEIEYNDIYNDYIIGVNIEQLYTLPYINYKNNWSLYSGDTDISAVGKDAGNPNIIIIYNYKNDYNDDIECNIVSGVFNNQLLKYDTVTGNFGFYVEDFFGGNDQTTKIVKTAKYKLPKIDKSNVDFLTYATIILVTDVNCVNNPNNDINENGKYLTSIWHVDIRDNAQKQNGYTQFKFIHYTENENIAFNLNKLFNITSFVPAVIDDEYIKKLKIDGKFANKFKLTNTNLSNYSDKFILEYLNAQEIKDNNANIHYSYTEDNITYYVSSYIIPSVMNNSNIALKFNSEIFGNINGDNKMNNSYLMSNSFNNSIKVDSTNYLYPKFTSVYTHENNISYVSSMEYVLQTTDDINSSIYVNNGDSTEYVYSDSGYTNAVLAVVNEYSYSFDIIYGDGTDNKQSNYYNEYTFNNNVPTLNLSSVFVQDINAINRLNIVSVDKEGYTYNGYIGTRFDNDDKTHLVIGSSSTNINLNNTYLISLENINKFNKHAYLDLDFDNILIGSDKMDLIETINQLKEEIAELKRYHSSTPIPSPL